MDSVKNFKTFESLFIRGSAKSLTWAQVKLIRSSISVRFGFQRRDRTNERNFDQIWIIIYCHFSIKCQLFNRKWSNLVENVKINQKSSGF